ncbi:MAG: hypothetical protein WA002_15530, partial [Candidatus Acidiferrales bacterium]
LTPAAAPSFAATYTPPPTLPAAPNNTPTITATSVTDTTKSAFDAFSIQSPSLPISVTITNPFTQITAGAAPVTIDAHVTNDQDNQGVTWSILPTAGTGGLGAATATSIQYTAPNQAPEPPDNTPTITATSVADPTKFDSFTFTIEPANATAAACSANGSYAFRLAGEDSAGNPLEILGAMTFDGGQVVINSVDVNDNFQVASGGGIAGACAYAGGTAGTITFDAPLPGLGSAPSLYVNFYANDAVNGTLQALDWNGKNLSGEILLQNPDAFAGLGGDFVFRITDDSTAPAVASIGRFTLSFDGETGSLSNGLMDASALGFGPVISAGALTGTATPPDSTGRGMMNLSFAGQPSRTFAYYAVAANEFFLGEMQATAGAQASPTAVAGFRPTFASGIANGQSLGSLTSSSLNAATFIDLVELTEPQNPVTPRKIQGFLAIAGLSGRNPSSANITFEEWPTGGMASSAPSGSGREGIATFDPATGRGTLAIGGGAAAGFIDSAAMYLTAPSEGRFLETSAGAADHGFSGSLHSLKNVETSVQH